MESEEQASDPRRHPIVYDTVVVLQAALNPDGPAARAVRLMDEGRVEVFVSNRLRSEYEETLSDPVVRSRFPHLTDERVQAILGRFDALAQRIPNPPRRIEFPRDPEDEPVLNLAVQVGADFILSRDRDLLDLAGDPLLRCQFPTLRILDPVTFLQEIDREQAADRTSEPSIEPAAPQPDPSVQKRDIEMEP